MDLLGGVAPKLFGAAPKLDAAPKGSVLVFERVTAGAAPKGSEVFGVSEEKFADHTEEPNGSSVLEDVTDETENKYKNIAQW